MVTIAEKVREDIAFFLFLDPVEPSSIGQIEFDVLVSHDTVLSAEVTENPVEEGFPVHDHVVLRPLKLSMVVAISSMPVTWYDRFGLDPMRMENNLEKIWDIYLARQPVMIITHNRVYEDMVMTEFKFSRNKEDGRIYKIPMEFTQIRKVQVKTAEIPAEYVSALAAGKAGKTEAEAGAAQQTTVSAEASNSTDSGGGGETTGGKAKSVLKGLFS